MSSLITGHTQSLRHPSLGEVNPLFRIGWVVVLFIAAACLAGCQTAGFYAQSIEGQFALLRGREPITKVLADPAAPDSLKRKLELVLELRVFAARELHLPVDGHYLTYADLGRRFAVWNVHAAPEFSLEQKAWWYPFVGRLTYRGYFSETDAHRHGDKLERHGYDVYIEGVETYSTLGWFKDPMLNTLIHHSETILAEILFHELAHQQVFVAGDTDFNEAFATAVAEEGVKRWLRARGNDLGLQRYESALRRQQQFVNLVMTTRDELKTLYDQDMRKTHRSSASVSLDYMREHKARILLELHAGYQQLKAGWDDYSGYDSWFDQPINNAQLNSVAAYFDLVPGFQQMIRANGGDLKRFYAAAHALRKTPKAERHRVVKQSAVNPRFEL